MLEELKTLWSLAQFLRGNSSDRFNIQDVETVPFHANQLKKIQDSWRNRGIID